MTKSPDAFRTISEVAEWLDVPAHVLRFWESRFAQVKPLKRAGGRRYYRPTDMELLGGIKRLLHDDGLTIRGVQKLLREEGIRHVAALSPAITADEDDIEMSDETGSEDAGLNAPGPLFGGGDGPARTDAEDAPTPDAFGVSPELYAPAPSILARLVGLDRRRFAEAGVDPAPLLERAQALAAVMDRHG